MHWVTGIGIEGRQLVGNTVSTASDNENVDLKDLANIGLPEENTSHRIVTQNFSHWRSADPTDYVRAFDSALARKATKGHLVFETIEKRTRILIPALALIRSFFRPLESLLPMIFRPQALQQVCHLDLSVIPARLVIAADWDKLTLEKLIDISSGLDWMSSFPSAARMAASVHEYALQGVIGIRLPMARARISLRGKKVGDTLLVTRIIIQDLKALEAPFPYAGGSSRKITYGYRPSGDATELFRSIRIPLNAAGSVDLSDDEWSVIAPILLKYGCTKKTVLDQRLLFDGLLRKFALNQGWGKVQYRIGNRNNAVFAFRKWARQGTFQASITAICNARSAQKQAA